MKLTVIYFSTFMGTSAFYHIASHHITSQTVVQWHAVQCTYPMFDLSHDGSKFLLSSPSHRINPSEGSYSRSRRRKRVLFPLPGGPTIARYCPVDTAKVSTMRVKGEELAVW